MDGVLFIRPRQDHFKHELVPKNPSSSAIATEVRRNRRGARASRNARGQQQMPKITSQRLSTVSDCAGKKVFHEHHAGKQRQ